MKLEIQSYRGGARASVRLASSRFDSKLMGAYGTWRLHREDRDSWLDYFEVSAAVRKKAEAKTIGYLMGGDWVQFTASAEDFERALADERGRKYVGVLKGVK